MRLYLLVVILVASAHGWAQTVILDPGHPSEVGNGTKGKITTEVHVAWTVANQVKVELEKHGYKVLLTKAKEATFVRNKDRADIANQAKASLMLRLHCDAANGTGFTVFYPDQQGTSGKHKGPTPALLKRIKPIATQFHQTLSKAVGSVFRDNGLLPDSRTLVGSKQGALTGSIFAKVPVVLVEMCVLTNEADEAKILSKRGREAMVRGLVAAVRAAVPLPKKKP